MTADDQVAVMDALGFHRFHLAGHDRGGRVGHRLALDHPDRVRSLTVLDIAPTYTMYTTTDMTFAEAYYHWFFLIQPYDLPERLIGNDPEYFLRRKFAQWGRDDTAFTAEAMAEYVRCFTLRPSTHRARTIARRRPSTCPTIRRTSTPGHRLSCPVLALWGVNGFVGRNYDVIDEWRVWADDVRGSALASGHFVPEEAPGETLDALFGFYRDDG